MAEFKNHLSYKRALDEMYIAVVDDLKFTQMIIRTILQPLRLKKLRFYETAEAALQEMKLDAPCMLIADWRIQDTAGAKLLELVRRADMGRLACTSVIVTLENPTRHDAECAFKLGAHAIVTKPFSLQSLQRRVQWVIRDTRKLHLHNDHLVIEGIDQREKCESQAKPLAASVKEEIAAVA